MENMNICDTILDKKLDYTFDANNFEAASEIMVTITLREYRDLVEKNATSNARIKNAEQDKYTRDTENEKLKKEVSELRSELYELKKLSE